ncbi:MAG: lamin tail domain-containing protein [Planctomycetota bacterium]|nr:MAG: lamin tail domain-containing protein [Planctomycetota bacterium]
MRNVIIYLIVLVLASAGMATTATAQLVINEIDYDQPGTDDGEFIEIKNTGTSSVNLAGYAVELVNGSGGGAVLYKIISLPDLELESGGYFVVCGNAANVDNCDLDVSTDTNLIQNGTPDAVAISFNNAVIDTVSYGGDTGAPYTEGSGSGLLDPWSNIPGGPEEYKGISRFPDGVDTDQNNVDFSVRCITPGEANIAQNIDCDDTLPPEISCPAEATVECDGSTDPSATGTATATDDTDPDPTIDFSDSITSGLCSQELVIIRTWTATDQSGKSSACEQIINVVDTTPPVLSGVPGDVTVECDAVPEAAVVTAGDNCDQNPTVQFNEKRTDGSCPNSYVLERTWTATDGCSNETIAVQTITVQDTTPPVIELIGDEIIILECNIDIYEEQGATVTDNCDTVAIEVIIGGDVVDTNNPGEYIVTYNATDACSNDATQVTRTVIVEDTTPPEVTIDDIEDLIDDSVADGSLWGDGPGKSADKRLNALKNMIETAGDLIEDGLFADACQQLADAYKKTDGEDKPPDFVSGPAAAELAAMILDLMDSLGCE